MDLSFLNCFVDISGREKLSSMPAGGGAVPAAAAGGAAAPAAEEKKGEQLHLSSQIESPTLTMMFLYNHLSTDSSLM